MKTSTKIIFVIFAFILFSTVILSLTSSYCHADNSAWEISVFGIQAKHFKDRNPYTVILGAITSYVVHEMSHLLWAKTHGGGDWSGRDVVYYYDMDSKYDQQMFNRAGFLGQLLTGSILTAIHSTRHSDFTLGFNAYTTFNTMQYTITDGGDGKYSDINQLQNGRTEGTIYTIAAGILTYVNLKKDVGNSHVNLNDYINHNIVLSK